ERSNVGEDSFREVFERSREASGTRRMETKNSSVIVARGFSPRGLETQEMYFIGINFLN
ncbi:MAG: hypothetical protein RL156_286, partial [Bacteroidota bacterium]